MNMYLTEQQLLKKKKNHLNPMSTDISTNKLSLGTKQFSNEFVWYAAFEGF